MCIELSMVVTELGLPHIIRSDNSPCYNSKEFQQFLQCYSITHQTSSPNHPRSNGFVERMVGVAKKLMEKLEKKGNCGFQVCLVTGSHPSQATTGNNSKPERKYQSLFPGTPVWVQHKQNATWEPAIVVNQCTPNSYSIMQENGAEQPKVYRCIRSMLKIRSTPTDGGQKAQMREWSTETDNTAFHIQTIPYGNRNVMVKNSQGHYLPNSLAPPLPSLDLPESENFSENREESQIAEPQLCRSGTTLRNVPDAPDAPIAPGTCKSTCENFGKPAKKYSDQLYL